jgi:hypothetical protein
VNYLHLGSQFIRQCRLQIGCMMDSYVTKLESLLVAGNVAVLKLQARHVFSAFRIQDDVIEAFQSLAVGPCLL